MKMEKNKLSQSLEDYLEAVYLIEKEKKVVRVKDISSLLKVKKPSVVSALKVLEAKGLINHEKYGYVELTPEGRREARRVYRMHRILKKFLVKVLGVEESVAEEDACMIEHYLHQKTFDRLVKFLEFIETCPEDVPFWLRSFHYYAERGIRPPECGKGRRRESEFETGG